MCDDGYQSLMVILIVCVILLKNQDNGESTRQQVGSNVTFILLYMNLRWVGSNVAKWNIIIFIVIYPAFRNLNTILCGMAPLNGFFMHTIFHNDLPLLIQINTRSIDTVPPIVLVHYQLLFPAKCGHRTFQVPFELAWLIHQWTWWPTCFFVHQSNMNGVVVDLLDVGIYCLVGLLS